MRHKAGTLVMTGRSGVLGAPAGFKAGDTSNFYCLFNAGDVGVVLDTGKFVPNYIQVLTRQGVCWTYHTKWSAIK